MRATILSAIGLLAVGTGWAQETKPTLKELTDRWRSEKAADRDDATRKVLGGWEGWSAEELRILAKLQADSDSEVRTRAQSAAQRIETYRRYGRALVETIGDLNVLEADAGDEAHLQVLIRLLKAAEKGEIQEPQLEQFSRDQAKRWKWGAKLQVSFSETIRRKPFAAFLVPLIVEDGPPMSKSNPMGWAAHALVDLGARHCAPDIAALLKREDAQTRMRAVWVLGEFGAKDYVGAILPLIKDPDDGLKYASIKALGALGVKESARELVPVLKDKRNEWARSYALESIGRLGAKEHVQELVACLQGTDWPVSAYACVALVRLGAREQAKDIVPLLKHEEDRTRAEAVWALGELGAKEYVREIASLLKDREERVRSNAITAIGQLGAKQYAGEIVPFLTDDVYNGSRYQAFLALRQLGTKECIREIAAAIRGMEFSREYTKFPYVVAAACLAQPGGEKLAESSSSEFIRDISPLKELFEKRGLKIEGPPGLKVSAGGPTESLGQDLVSTAYQNGMLFTFQDRTIKFVEWEDGKRWWLDRLKE